MAERAPPKKLFDKRVRLIGRQIFCATVAYLKASHPSLPPHNTRLWYISRKPQNWHKLPSSSSSLWSSSRASQKTLISCRLSRLSRVRRGGRKGRGIQALPHKNGFSWSFGRRAKMSWQNCCLLPAKWMREREREAENIIKSNARIKNNKKKVCFRTFWVSAAAVNRFSCATGSSWKSSV